jgi:hypothetical protein
VHEFYSIKNGDTLDAPGVDGTRLVIWRCSCGCYLGKSRHAVSANIRDHAPGQHTCFLCPIHRDIKPASKYAVWGWATACGVAAELKDEGFCHCTVVLEAHVLGGRWGAFDMWMHPCKLVVEVDGEHHFRGSMYGKANIRQRLADKRKEDAAVEAGYHVVRMHYKDRLVWANVLEQGLRSVVRGRPPCVHRSPTYLLESARTRTLST